MKRRPGRRNEDLPSENLLIKWRLSRRLRFNLHAAENRGIFLFNADNRNEISALKRQGDFTWK
jgi:hypothetical protein